MLHSALLLITRNKTLNKTTCTTPSENPHQLCAHWFKNFPTAMKMFRGFQDFLIYLSKYFSSVLKSSNLTFQPLFCKSKVNKTVELVSLRIRDIIKVITVTHFLAKMYFLSLIRFLKCKKRSWS